MVFNGIISCLVLKYTEKNQIKTVVINDTNKQVKKLL